jgi:predicted ATPase/DNA-binding SARP family transcriptional activator/Tfp pilus assembly protein PilF
VSKADGENVVAVGLLGPVVLFADGAPSPSRSAMLRTLLALVALRPGQAVSSAAIAEELWRDALPKDPRAALHVIATRLRKWLESAGIGAPALRFDHDAYVLEIDPRRVDATLFGELTAQSTDVSEYDAALALWRGDPFGGCVPGTLLEIEATRLHERRLQILEARGEALLASGRHDLALIDAQSLLAEYPTRERLVSLAMVALYRDGRHHEALAVFQTHRGHVVDEYGLEPSRELVALEARILDRDETLLHPEPGLVLPLPPEVVSSPTKDPSVGTQLREVPTDAPDNNLPAAVTSFVGRADELAQLRSKLSDGARLITITGPGGIGKTRLAVEAACALLDRFSNGVWLVDLSPLSDPSAILAAVASTLDTADPDEKLSGGPTLLVLDNLEHLLSGVVAISDLLARCPQLVILATSRERLRLQGEHDVELAGLPSSDAVDLFATRASAANRSVGDSDAVDALCARVDGMPLAIELAAARLRTQSVEQLLAALDAMLDVLGDGERDRPERHQAMRAAIAVSVTGLSEPERSVFRAFAVFAGGATADAVADICHPKGDAVATLVDKSLLRATPDGRFTMLEPIRQYAEELLADDEFGERDERIAAHAAYFLALAEEAEPHLVTGRQHEWMDVLVAEHANLRRAWERGEADTPLRIAACLKRFWAARDPSEGRAVLGRALKDCADAEPAVRAQALLGAAHLAILQSDFEQASPALQEAVALRDPAANPTAHNLLGETARLSGDLDAAERHYANAINAAEAIGDDRVVALVRNNQGAAAHARGDIDAAAELWRDALAASERLNDHQQITRVLSNLGFAYRQLGAHDNAIATLQRSLDLARASADRGLEANALFNLAAALADTATDDDFGEREALIREAIDIYDELGLRRELADALLSVPGLTNDIEMQLGALARARAILAELDDTSGVEFADVLRKSVLADRS